MADIEEDQEDERPVDFIPQRDIFGQARYTSVPDTTEDGQHKITISISNYVIANNWNRFMAYVIDCLIGFVALSSIQYFLTGTINRHVENLITVVFHTLYFGGFVSSAWQATPGKKIMGLKIIQESGKPISFGRAAGRFWAAVLSFIVLLLGYIRILRDKKERRGWHDLIASTYVVSDNTDKCEPANKRDLGYLVLVGLIIISAILMMHVINEVIIPQIQEMENRKQAAVSENGFNVIKDAEKKVTRYADVNFMFTDSSNKFEILIKADRQYYSTTKPNTLCILNSDGALLYQVTIVNGASHLEKGTILKSLQAHYPDKYEFSQLTQTKGDKGYTIEDGILMVKNSHGEAGESRCYLRGYTNDNGYYVIWFYYNTQDELENETSDREDILKSFKILK